MFVLIVTLIIAIFMQRYLLNHSLDGVTFTLSATTSVVSPNEPFQIQSLISNNKKHMPVLLQIQELLPVEISLADSPQEDTAPKHNHFYHQYTQYMRPMDCVTRSHCATLPHRGRYFFSGANLYGNDFLGIQERQIRVECYAEIVVAPAPLSSPKLEDTLGGFLGDLSVRRFIMEDPVLTVGFREYSGREPMRALAWNQIARGRGLMVKQYDYTTEPSVTLLLNITEGTHPQIEDCYSIARSVCETLEKKHIRYHIITNAASAGFYEFWNSVTSGLGSQHFNKVLEGLGRATYDHTESLFAMLNRAYHQSNAHDYHILITPQENSQTHRYVQQFSALKGGSVQVITPVEVLS